VSKKLADKQRKRLAEQMKRDQQRKAARRSNVITIGIAVVIITFVALVVMNVREDNGGDAPPAPEGVSAAKAGCDEIQEFPEEGRDHVTGEVDYKTSPPTSGDHAETPADAGFYPDPIPKETVVHNLEHGQIVIWYDPNAPQELIDSLEKLADNANDPANAGGGAAPILAVPYDDMPAGKTYVMTAWQNSQACEAYSLEAINAFRTKFQGRGPEQVTATFTDGQ
jgi:hypothetical protein